MTPPWQTIAARSPRWFAIIDSMLSATLRWNTSRGSSPSHCPETSACHRGSLVALSSSMGMYSGAFRSHSARSSLTSIAKPRRRLTCSAVSTARRSGLL